MKKTKTESKELKEATRQIILTKRTRHNIINFLLDNKDSIIVEDLKIYEPIYKCYREKRNCHYL